MTRRRAIASIGLAIVLASSLAATARAQSSVPSPGPVDTYRVSITLPGQERRSAVVLVERDAAELSGMLIVDGAPAAALRQMRVAGSVLTADVTTTAGAARLTLQLEDGTGTGSLALLERSRQDLAEVRR